MEFPVLGFWLMFNLSGYLMRIETAFRIPRDLRRQNNSVLLDRAFGGWRAETSDKTWGHGTGCAIT